MQHIPEICVSICGAAWLHNLGAGWDAADIRSWAGLGCFDSIDSIAYYTDARAGRGWGGEAAADWRETAEANARAANVDTGAAGFGANLA